MERPRKKKPAISFRIDGETIIALRNLAGSEHSSLNALVNNILMENVHYFLPAKKYGSKLIHGKILKRMLEEIDEKRLGVIAQELGKETFTSLNESEWMPKNSLGLRKQLCDLFCLCANWANYYEERRGKIIQVNLMHNNGLKWSFFMKNFFYWEFTQLEDLKIEDAGFICSESRLDISFPADKTGS